MALVAIVSRTPPVSTEEWAAFAQQDSRLVAPRARTTTNPFTGDTHHHLPPQTDVNVVVDGRVIGGLSLSPEFPDNGEIEVFCPEQVTAEYRDLVDSIAKNLGADVEWL